MRPYYGLVRITFRTREDKDKGNPTDASADVGKAGVRTQSDSTDASADVEEEEVRTKDSPTDALADVGRTRDSTSMDATLADVEMEATN